MVVLVCLMQASSFPRCRAIVGKTEIVTQSEILKWKVTGVRRIVRKFSVFIFRSDLDLRLAGSRPWQDSSTKNVTRESQDRHFYAQFTLPTWRDCFVGICGVNWVGDSCRQFSVVLNIFRASLRHGRAGPLPRAPRFQGAHQGAPQTPHPAPDWNKIVTKTNMGYISFFAASFRSVNITH